MRSTAQGGPSFRGNLLFDFSKTANYNVGDTSVADLSGRGNNGIPVTSNGNGTSVTMNTNGMSYNTGNGTLDFATNNYSSAYFNSIRLPNQFKFPGRLPYTIIIWFKRSDFFPGTTFQGLVAAQGASFGGVNSFGFVTALSYTGITYIGHDRINGVGGTADSNNITFGAGGVLSFNVGSWYMAAFGYNGSTMYTSLYDRNGSRIDASKSSSASISTDNNYSAFLGLRYNDWQQNSSIGYLNIYDTWVDTRIIDNIYRETKGQYGY